MCFAAGSIAGFFAFADEGISGAEWLFLLFFVPGLALTAFARRA
jgi:hypothetical protein